MEEMIPFLRMIAENPDDDAPRLVFADWLDEHEHHERAEFIRLQIELARMDPSDEGYPEKTARMRRCGVFTSKGEYPYFDHLPSGKMTIGFRRGFIDGIHAGSLGEKDREGFDLLPLQTLFVGGKTIQQYKQFNKLKRLSYSPSEGMTADDWLELFGPKGHFREIEQLVLRSLDRTQLQSGFLPKSNLPKLRDLYLQTDPFYYLGAPVEDTGDPDDYQRARPWAGLADYLPRNAIPNAKSPLERYIWYSSDDCDYFGDEDYYWRGPTMESLLSSLDFPNLKQVEVSVYYDDHENGGEGRMAAPYQVSPMQLKSSLESVTLDDVSGFFNRKTPGKLKSLRVYCSYFRYDELFSTLRTPICSELESFYLADRYGDGGGQTENLKKLNLKHLKKLYFNGRSNSFFENCEMPNLISFTGFADLDTLLNRKWPKLQYLRLDGDLKSLKKFAKSDCFPNLTTLEIGEYAVREGESISFLAKCEHMPNLSLILMGDSYARRYSIVKNGKIIPCRKDIIPTEEDIIDEVLNGPY